VKGVIPFPVNELPESLNKALEGRPNATNISLIPRAAQSHSKHRYHRLTESKDEGKRSESKEERGLLTLNTRHHNTS